MENKERGQCGGWCGPAFLSLPEEVTLRQGLRAVMQSAKLRTFEQNFDPELL